jgi:hypothetical protein
MRLLEDLGVAISMDGKSRAFDNFFEKKALKSSCIYYVSVKLTPSSGRCSDMPYSFLITTQEGGGSDGD